MKGSPRPHLRDPWEYAREYLGDQAKLDDHQRYAKYCPEVFQGYMTLRQGAFMSPPGGALPLKYKELLCVAIECALMKANPPPIFHARRAIDKGATPQEMAEVVSMCIMLRGMATYRQAGRFALQAAEERAGEIGRGTEEGKAAETGPRAPILDPREYARQYFADQSILGEHERYAKYCPEVFEGFMTLRQGACMAPPGGWLPLKYKELVLVAIECAIVVPSKGHARRAIDEGATLQEVAEAVCLCIMLGGMVTYMHSGRFALQAAEERAEELASGVIRKEER